MIAIGLSGSDATAIVSDVQQAIGDQWRQIFCSAGMANEQIARLARYFEPLPL